MNHHSDLSVEGSDVENSNKIDQFNRVPIRVISIRLILAFGPSGLPFLGGVDIAIVIINRSFKSVGAKQADET
jgi:hypothetical protein